MSIVPGLPYQPPIFCDPCKKFSGPQHENSCGTLIYCLFSSVFPLLLLSWLGLSILLIYVNGCSKILSTLPPETAPPLRILCHPKPAIQHGILHIYLILKCAALMRNMLTAPTVSRIILTKTSLNIWFANYYFFKLFM